MTFNNDDNLNYQDNDDNVSEISVSSEIRQESAMYMVFDQIFDSEVEPERL